MTAFRYRAMTPAGRLVSGLYEAPTEAAVFRYVRSAGNFPLAAKVSGRSLLRLLPARNKRPPLRVLARATQELAALISAGVELDRKILADIAVLDADTFRRFADRAREALSAG